jgi:hypothetical protein
MAHRSIRHPIPGGFVEEGIFEHEGRSFSAGGAAVHGDRAAGYPKRRGDYGYVLMDWNGKEVVGTDGAKKKCWRTPRSHVSNEMCVFEFTIGGRRFTGRSAGEGMFWQGRAKRR